MGELCDVGVIGSKTFVREVAEVLSQKDFFVSVLNSDNGMPRPPSFPAFVRTLRAPRTILISMEPSHLVDAMLNDLIPFLSQGDIVVDCSDSHFKETAARSRRLADRALHFLALGVGGASEGRLGTVLMVGGRREIYERTLSIWDAWAASKGNSRVGYFGAASAAHFLKMAHRAIDLSLMQLLHETLEIARRLPTFGPVTRVSAEQRLQFFLNDVFGPTGGEEQMEACLHAVKGSPFARWFSQAGSELGIPTPTIDVVMGMQTSSARDRQRELVSSPSRRPVGRFANDAASIGAELETAFHTAMIITYAEGMAVIATASERFGFQFDMPEIMRVWRGACRLRAPLLDDIAAAIRLTPQLPNLLFDDDLAEKVMAGQEMLRHVVWRATEMNLEAPGLVASLDYLDNHREAWLPMNLIQPLPEDRLEPVPIEDDSVRQWQLGESA